MLYVAFETFSADDGGGEIPLGVFDSEEKALDAIKNSEEKAGWIREMELNTVYDENFSVPIVDFNGEEVAE